MDNIREDKGYTYGIYSYLQNHIRETAWTISAEVGREVAAATLHEIKVEMKRLREEPIDPEELKMARNYLVGTTLSELDGPFSVISRWRHLILNNVDEQYFYAGLAAIRDTPAKQLQILANRYLQPDDFYEVVVI